MTNRFPSLLTTIPVSRIRDASYAVSARARVCARRPSRGSAAAAPTAADPPEMPKPITCGQVGRQTDKCPVVTHADRAELLPVVVDVRDVSQFEA